jgi:hypothetical protein
MCIFINKCNQRIKQDTETTAENEISTKTTVPCHVSPVNSTEAIVERCLAESTGMKLYVMKFEECRENPTEICASR